MWARHKIKKSSDDVELHAIGVRGANNLYVKGITIMHRA